MKRRISLFNIINCALLVLFALVCLLPMIYILSRSFSSESAITSGKVWLWPVGFNTMAYKFVLTTNFVKPFIMQLVVTVAGTALSLLLLVMFAYPLSRPDLAFKKQFTLLIMVTMMFNAGMIPGYLLISKLDMLNTLWALILPPAFSGYNTLMVKAYMQSIPGAVVESAVVEGATHTRILFKLIVPLSIPVLATMTLFCAVSYWHSYFDAMLYISKPNMRTLQVFLRDIVLNSLQNVTENYVYDADSIMVKSPEGLRAASIVTTTVPILLVYPFLQKYYISGIMIGSVKG